MLIKEDQYSETESFEELDTDYTRHHLNSYHDDHMTELPEISPFTFEFSHESEENIEPNTQANNLGQIRSDYNDSLV